MNKKNIIRNIINFLLIASILSMTLSSCGATRKKGEIMTQAQYDSEYNAPTNINTEAVSRVAGGFWPAPPGFGGNLIGAQTGDPGYYIYESMFEIIKGTDQIIPVLTKSYENKGNATIVHLQQNRYWNDGVKFTSKDLWAYYIINYQSNSMLKYLTGVKIIDDYTLEFDWVTPMVSDLNKLLFLADGWQAVTPYHIFKNVVDQAVAILQKGTTYSGPAATRPSLGIQLSSDDSASFAALYNQFKGVNVPMPVGTGPYMVDKVTNTECILKQNPYFPNKEKLPFKSIDMQNVADYNSLLAKGRTDSFVGTLPYDITKNILNQSKDMVMYPLLETKCVGVLFDTNKTPFDNKTFRQAMNYILDKAPVRQMANYWGKDSDVATTGIIPSDISKYVDPKVASKIEKYTTNTAKAAQMLESLGWKKNSAGKWVDKNDKKYTFIISANNGWGNQGVGAATVVAQQLTAFGLDTQAKSVDSTVVVSNMKTGQYDMTIDFIDYTWDDSDPYRCLSQYYGNVSEECGITADALPKLTLKDMNGNSFNVKDAVNKLLYLPNGKERTDTISKLVWATNDNAIGINLYQNVMSMWENVKTQKGLPMEKNISHNGGLMPFPTNDADYKAVAELNREYAPFALRYTEGVIKPR